MPGVNLCAFFLPMSDSQVLFQKPGQSDKSLTDALDSKTSPKGRCDNVRHMSVAM